MSSTKRGIVLKPLPKFGLPPSYFPSHHPYNVRALGYTRKPPPFYRAKIPLNPHSEFGRAPISRISTAWLGTVDINGAIEYVIVAFDA
ncbi:hypothetical protein ALPO108162_09180 [Alicyclobacillus pomorum]